MRKVSIVVALLAMAIVPALADGPDIKPIQNAGALGADAEFGASFGVSLEVEPYAMVHWGPAEAQKSDASVSLTVGGPFSFGGSEGWVKGKNWDRVPLLLKSNCDVTLTVREGIGRSLVKAGLPAGMVWMQQDQTLDDFENTVYKPILEVIQPSKENPDQPFGTVFIDMRPSFLLPDGDGYGGGGSQVFGWGQDVGQPGNIPPAGTCTLYTGSMVIPVAVGLHVSDVTYVDDAEKSWDWTSLPVGAELEDTKVWAILSPAATDTP